MRLVFYLSLIEVTFGMAVILCFIPRKSLGAGFGKTVASIIFLCLLPAVLLLRALLPLAPEMAGELRWLRAAGFAVLALWFAYFVVMNYPRERIQRTLVVLATLAQAFLIFLTCRILVERFHDPVIDAGFGPSPGSLMVSLLAGISTSGFLLGSVTMAMLIGHWYLVIPGLPIRWLKGGCIAFGTAIALKAMAIALSLMVGASSDPFGPQGFFDRFRVDVLPIFAVKTLLSLVIPAAFCAMAYRAAAIRSTQSSTGILFPTMIIVFIGEMIGSYLIIGLAGLSV